MQDVRCPDVTNIMPYFCRLLWGKNSYTTIYEYGVPEHVKSIQLHFVHFFITPTLLHLNWASRVLLRDCEVIDVGKGKSQHLYNCRGHALWLIHCKRLSTRSWPPPSCQVTSESTETSKLHSIVLNPIIICMSEHEIITFTHRCGCVINTFYDIWCCVLNTFYDIWRTDTCNIRISFSLSLAWTLYRRTSSNWQIH